MKKILSVILMLCPVSSFFVSAASRLDADFNDEGGRYCFIAKYDKNYSNVPIKIYANPGDSAPVKILTKESRGFQAIAKKGNWYKLRESDKSNGDVGNVLGWVNKNNIEAGPLHNCS
jgi:hypothetical protein